MSMRCNLNRLDVAKISYSKTLQQRTKKTTSGKVALTGYKVRNIQYEGTSCILMFCILSGLVIHVCPCLTFVVAFFFFRLT